MASRGNARLRLHFRMLASLEHTVELKLVLVQQELMLLVLDLLDS